jgi:hypothetical protein
MQIDPEDASSRLLKLSTFRTAGLYVYGGLAFYESEDVAQIAAGGHTVSLRTCAPGLGNQYFASLERAGEPTSRFVFAWLVRGAGWLLLALGVVATAKNHLMWVRGKRAASLSG